MCGLARTMYRHRNLFLGLRVCRVTWCDDDKRGEGAWERGCVSVLSWKSAILIELFSVVGFDLTAFPFVVVSKISLCLFWHALPYQFVFMHCKF